MKRQIPQVIQEGNVYIDGIGYLGVTKKLKLPTIEFEMIESKGAVSVLDKNMWVNLGLNSFTNRIPWLFKASIFQSGKSKTVPFSAAFTGDIISYEVSEFESGKELEVTIKLSAHFVDINVDGVPMVLKDSENMICVIGGVDYMAGVRSNLGE